MTTKRLKDWATKHIRAIRISLVLAMFLLATIGFFLGPVYVNQGYIINDSLIGQYLGYFLVNLGPELAGIVIGVVIIDYLNEWRQTEQLKAQLIRQMGSSIRDVAIPAVREMAHRRWLYDGSVEGADLTGTNLMGAILDWSHLEKVYLYVAQLERSSLNWSHLQGANLMGARLDKASLVKAHLEGANLIKAHLEGANLYAARLERADLRQTILERANLRRANLGGAWSLTPQQLLNADTVAGAIMPDGTKLKDPNEAPSFFGHPFPGNPHALVLSRSDPWDLKPYLEGPTLEEWLATKPDCLVWSEDEEE